MDSKPHEASEDEDDTGGLVWVSSRKVMGDVLGEGEGSKLAMLKIPSWGQKIGILDDTGRLLAS